MSKIELQLTIAEQNYSRLVEILDNSNIGYWLSPVLQQTDVSGAVCECKVNRVIVRHEDKDWCNICGKLVKAN